MDIDLSISPDFPALPQQAKVSPTTSNMTKTESHLLPSADAVSGITESANRMRSSRTSSSLLSNPSLTYQISFSMECTRAQLDSVMVGLAVLGPGVTIKIDAKL